MARKSRAKAKPTDPAEIARRHAEIRKNPAKWGANIAAMALPANADVQHEAATRERVERRQRFDVFHLLHARGGLTKLEKDSARRLQDDIAARFGLDGETSEVRGTGGSIEIITARKLEAAAKVDALLDWCGRPSSQILAGLCEPLASGRTPNWRQVVKDKSGEFRHIQQSDLVRAACKALAASYARWDGGERPRKRLSVAA